jgi:hypothetical protein
MYKKLNEYKSLSEVPLNHPEVKYKCLCPEIICGDAVGNSGCLGIDHNKNDCVFIQNK